MSRGFLGAGGCCVFQDYVVVYGEVDVRANGSAAGTANSMHLEVTAGASEVSRGLASTWMWSPRPPTHSATSYLLQASQGAMFSTVICGGGRRCC